MKRSVHGITLIELLVAVAILGILMLVGLPLTSSWIHGAQVSEAKSRLAQGYGPLPAGTVQAVGYGSGTRSTDERPTFVRAFLIDEDEGDAA